MIARSWDGLTAAGEAEAYAEYVRRTGVKDLLDTRGNRGVYLLRRREGDQTRFRVLSLWDSMEGIRRFAGDEPERARYYPEDERFLAALPPNVEHFEVVSQGGTRRAGAEARTLARELETLGRGDAWHGPALAGLLRGVSARTASARPIASAHTIWELVLHVTAWTDVFRRRIEGEALEEPEAGDFPRRRRCRRGAPGCRRSRPSSRATARSPSAWPRSPTRIYRGGSAGATSTCSSRCGPHPPRGLPRRRADRAVEEMRGDEARGADEKEEERALTGNGQGTNQKRSLRTLWNGFRGV